MQPDRHFLPAKLQDGPIRLLLVGCGGNGAQMLMGLASLDIALRAISSRSLQVTVVDDDTVSEANLGRQPFYPCDLGASKARTLVERVNLAHGLDWTAVHGRAPTAVDAHSFDVLVTCVDTAAARRAIGAAVAAEPDRYDRNPPHYWMDLGNRATDGQFLIGQPARPGDRPDLVRLPTVLETMHPAARWPSRWSVSPCSSTASWPAMPWPCCSSCSVVARSATPAPSSIWRAATPPRSHCH